MNRQDSRILAAAATDRFAIPSKPEGVDGLPASGTGLTGVRILPKHARQKKSEGIE